MTHSKRPWVVVLAGGDGRRLIGALVGGQRLDRPKQFCSLRGESLLRRTLRRAEGITTPDRTVVVVRHDHRRWWQEELRDLSPGNVLAQADNRGTGVAILHALAHVLQRDDNPTLVILPSDHSAENEATLTESARAASQYAASGHPHLVLLGITAERPETEYGWILPRTEDAARLRVVERFVEKPDAHLASALHAAGGLWNSFIFASSGHALLAAFEASHPHLLRTCFRAFLVRHLDESQERALYGALPRVDFCGEVLPPAVAHLRVLTVPACGWTDLGTPTRVNAWLERSRHEGGRRNRFHVQRGPRPEPRRSKRVSGTRGSTAGPPGGQTARVPARRIRARRRVGHRC